MKSQHVLVPLLLCLAGCAADSFRLPWQNENSSTVVDDAILQWGNQRGASFSNRSQRPLDKPILSELQKSDLKPASAQAIAACVKRLQISVEVVRLADQTNFGERLSRDAWGRTISSKPQLIVLHETVVSEGQTVGLFQTAHPADEDQASYHLLIARDGRRIRIVPDMKRAYGAGMSAFGDATQRTKPGSVGSINNISLHVSLVSPDDGRDAVDAHSGYSDAQYRVLAAQTLLWQAKYGIPLTRVTTHAAVDRSRSRYDPRSFHWDLFNTHYRQAAKVCGFDRYDNRQAGL